MSNFNAIHLLEFKRFTRLWKLAVLLLLILVSFYYVDKGIEEYENTMVEKENFKKHETLKFEDLKNYYDYALSGVGVFLLPASPMSLFTSPPKLSGLIGKCNSIAKLDIESSGKDRSVSQTNAPFPMRFSFIVLIIGSLAGLFMGYESMHSPEYLKFLSGNASSSHNVFFSIILSRFILIALSFIFIFLLMLGALVIHNITLNSIDFPGLLSYAIVTLLIILFFFLAGTIVGNSRFKRMNNTLLFGIGFAFVIVVPGILDSVIFEKSLKIPSPYELYENKLSIVNNFERQSEEAYGKFNPKDMETERKIVEGYWQNELKKIETKEEQFKNKIEKVIRDYSTYSIFNPITFYNYVTGEASSRGFGTYLEFYSYMQKIWKSFVRFWIDRVYYNDPKKFENFIKADENIFKSHSLQPDNFLKGVLVNSGYLIILYLVSFLLFKRSLSSLTISKQELAGLGNLNIELGSSELKIWLSKNHYFRDILFNILSGNKKKLNRKGITGAMLINGVDSFATGSRQKFLYLCHPNHFPGDIKVKDLITYYAKVQKASRKELNMILNSAEIKPIGKKYMAQLEDANKFQALVALLQIKRKQIYLIDNLSTGYPAECAIQLREQLGALCAEGATVIFLVSSVTLPESNKMTGAYDDGMHWLYMVEERKATFEIEHKIQKEKEINPK